MKTKLHLRLQIACLMICGTGYPFWPAVTPITLGNAVTPCESNMKMEGAIASLTLVDADTDQDITEMFDGMQLDQSQISGKKLTVRLDLDAPPELIDNVDFKLTGVLNETRRELVVPHSLFGDASGDYYGKLLPAGEYTLWVGVHEENGHYWDKMEIHFSVGDFEPELVSFHPLWGPNIPFHNLLNPLYGYPKMDDRSEFNSGNPNSVPKTFAVSWKTFTVGSVSMEITGPVSYSRTENQAPFTLFGDSNGTMNLRNLPDGAYELRATPYSLPNLSGDKGNTVTVKFLIHNFSGLSLRNNVLLIDAKDDMLINEYYFYLKAVIDNNEYLTENVTLSLPPSYNTDVKSVKMSLTGPVVYERIENEAPYALFGNNGFDFYGEDLPAGVYVLKATPFSGPNATGLFGPSSYFDFEIQQAMTTALKSDSYTLYPNPASADVVLRVKNGIVGSTVIYDLQGTPIREFGPIQTSETQLDISGIAKGIYLVRSTNGKRAFTKRLIIH